MSFELRLPKRLADRLPTVAWSLFGDSDADDIGLVSSFAELEAFEEECFR